MHTRFKPFVMGALMLSVTAGQTTIQAQEASSTAAASSGVTVADFAGKWAGRWSGGGAGSTLTVTDVEPPKVKYCYGGHCRSKNLKDVRFEEGELRFGWSKGKFRFSLNGETLEGTYVNSRGNTYTVEMTRK